MANRRNNTNNAANAAQSSTMCEYARFTPATAREFIEQCNDRLGRKALYIREYAEVVYVKAYASETDASSVTKPLRIAANVIAGVYGTALWNKSDRRYEIPRAKWDAAKTAASPARTTAPTRTTDHTAATNNKPQIAITDAIAKVCAYAINFHVVDADAISFAFNDGISERKSGAIVLSLTKFVAALGGKFVDGGFSIAPKHKSAIADAFGIKVDAAPRRRGRKPAGNKPAPESTASEAATTHAASPAHADDMMTRMMEMLQQMQQQMASQQQQINALTATTASQTSNKRRGGRLANVAK